MPSVDLCCLRLCCRATVAWAGPEQQCGGRTAKQRLRERGFPLAAWAGPAPDRLAPSSAAGVRGIYAACKSLSVVSSVHHRVHVWRFFVFQSHECPHVIPFGSKCYSAMLSAFYILLHGTSAGRAAGVEKVLCSLWGQRLLGPAAHNCGVGMPQQW